MFSIESGRMEVVIFFFFGELFEENDPYDDVLYFHILEKKMSKFQMVKATPCFVYVNELDIIWCFLHIY